MPSLNVPWVWRRKSSSSTPSTPCSNLICGMVASPTRTVGISSDSTSRIDNLDAMVLASTAAAIQPAVPPPTMTTFLICLSDISVSRKKTLPTSVCRQGIRERTVFALQLVVEAEEHGAAVLGVLPQRLIVVAELRAIGFVVEVVHLQQSGETLERPVLELVAGLEI